jgi:hypothetical protein
MTVAIEALDQSLDRLRHLERFRQGEANSLPAVDAAIKLAEKAIRALRASPLKDRDDAG